MGIHPDSNPPAVRRFSALYFLPLALLLVCCQHVAPYEREYLARPAMDVRQREAATAGFQSHIHEAREGGGGSGDTAGGGCGCN